MANEKEPIKEPEVKTQAPAPTVTKKEVPKHDFKLRTGEAVIALKESPANQIKTTLREWKAIYEKSGTWELVEEKTHASEKKG